MKLINLILFTFLSNLASAQFAIISDKDGSCNIRSSAALGDNIFDKLENGHFVYCLGNSGNWADINYNKNKKEHNGNVYSDRLKVITDYPALPQVSKGENNIRFAKDSIKVTVTQQKFDKSKYRFAYYKDATSQIEFINGKQYWGRDGDLPTTAYKGITVQVGTKTINLPLAAYDDLFEPTLEATKVNYDQQNDILYIQSSNSDGAGSYDIIWKIEKGVYKNRYVAYGF